MRQIIHVSGTSGSGKSYLGDFMQQIYTKDRLAVVDLDALFYSVLNSRAVRLARDSETRFNIIKQEVLKRVESLVSKYKNVLFVGYSDVGIDDKLRHIDIGANSRFFIDLPIETLIQQYRSRAARNVLGTRRGINVMSDDDLRRMVKLDKKLYSSYKRMPQKDIIKEIILAVGK